MSLSAEEYQALTARIVDVIGEHCSAYVLIAEVPKDDETHTVVIWHGGLNHALGMLDRGKMRVKEMAKRHDFPPHSF